MNMKKSFMALAILALAAAFVFAVPIGESDAAESVTVGEVQYKTSGENQLVVITVDKSVTGTIFTPYLDGTAINDVDAQTAAMQLPGDDQTGVGVGWSPNAQIGEPQGGLGGTGDMMSMADDMFGEPGTEMKEGEGDDGYDNVDFDLAALDKI